MIHYLHLWSHYLFSGETDRFAMVVRHLHFRNLLFFISQISLARCHLLIGAPTDVQSSHFCCWGRRCLRSASFPATVRCRPEQPLLESRSTGVASAGVARASGRCWSLPRSPRCCCPDQFGQPLPDVLRLGNPVSSKTL